jgi:hypothetical protein
MGLVAVPARWPRWLAVLLAAGAFAGLHSLASADLPATAFTALARAAAAVGQVAVPGVIVAGALLSLFRELRRADVLDTVAQRLCCRASSGAEGPPPLTAQELTVLVGGVYARDGWSVADARPRDDGGVDLMLRKEQTQLLVELKPRGGRSLGVEMLRG